MKELQRRGLPVSADLQKFAGNPGPKAGVEKGAVQALIASALDQLRGSATEAAAIPEDRELAQRLSRGMDTVSLAEWQARRQATENPSASRLDRLIAEVQVLGDDAEAENFAERARSIAFETSGGRRNLLTDSLMLDVAALIDARKRAATILADLTRAGAPLATIDSNAARSLLARVEAALAASDATAAQDLMKQAAELVDTHDRREAAAARRRAILTGLATLGYEVRENMATALEAEGRVVVRRPGSSDYGVEIAAPGEAARLAVRLVGAERPASTRSPQRDKDQETIWCGDLDKLQGLLRSQGSEFQIERAKDAGAEPVKTVAMPVEWTRSNDVGAGRSDARRI